MKKSLNDILNEYGDKELKNLKGYKHIEVYTNEKFLGEIGITEVSVAIYYNEIKNHIAVRFDIDEYDDFVDNETKPIYKSVSEKYHDKFMEIVNERLELELWLKNYKSETE